VKEIQELLKNPRDLVKAVESLVQERNDLRKELEQLQLEKSAGIKEQLKGQFVQKDTMQVLIAAVTLPNADLLKKLVYELKNEVSNACIVLAATIEDKPQVAVFIDESLLEATGLHAGNLVRELAKEIQGGGGGQPFFATAGGKDLAGLPQVVAKAKTILL
jgi:alanyl-tRNA synthetase